MLANTVLPPMAVRLFRRAPRLTGLTVVFAVTSLLALINVLDYISFIARPKNSDFFLYWFAAHMGVSRGWPAMYDPHIYMPALWEASHRLMPYLNPPPLAWLALPFTLMPYPVALWIWNVAMLGSLVLAWYLLAPGHRLDRAAHLWALFGLFVVEAALRYGQVTCLVMASFAVCWWLMKRDKPLLGGIVLGLMVLKPQDALLLPVVLLIAGYWRVFVGWALVVVPLGLASLIALGPVGLRAWYAATQAVWHVNRVELASANWFLPTPIAVAVGTGAGLLTFWTAWRVRRRGPELAMAVGITGSTLVTPYLAAYDLIALVISAWLALRSGLPTWAKVLLPIGYAALAWDDSIRGAPAVLAFQCVWLITLFLVSGRRREMWLPKLEPIGRRARRVVVLPAYRAEKTLRDVVAKIPAGEVDRILLVDDASSDRTAEVALELGIDVIKHPRNLGYGGNQKTCYANALLMGAQVVVMLHPDGQYDPGLVPALCRAIEEGKGEVVLGSRWLGLDPAAAGMPSWKRLGNRFLTWTENRILGLKLSEYHTGYRAYSRRFLETIPYAENSNDFVFDTQLLIQAAAFGFRVAEIPAVGRYFEDASSIGFKTSTVYGLKTLAALGSYLGNRAGLPSRWLKPRQQPVAPAISPEQAAA